ncbi:N-acetylmuramoyl-L-alanine amidase [Accumulibacter sp.]|uniref:N-acetylmuramoyl-L-alanine amidase family protein n=1 Tax=Accumulibacter sp. TaxID=2053492 RepID=UPI0025FA7B5F|nr:N-acetylmuramoyl-L-alanine amidase [Accumulibacter sp.]MCM8594693.1 N-acetylmuramoyl-L-alanine amidase [Accumulibacter sp.]
MLLVAATGGEAAEVAVDVGHTLAACGAISARGRCEYEFNAVLADLLAQELRARRIAVREINFDGLIDSLAARPQHAAGADFFISIHHDSVHPELLADWDWDGSSQTYSDVHRGFSLFVSRANPDLAGSLRCASAIGALLRRAGFSPTRHYAEPAAGPSRPVADLDNAVHFHDRLVVLYQTTLPAVLFEAGVIKHREEELALRDPARQIRMADAIASGIAACLQVNRATAGDEDPSQTRR